MSGLGLGIKRLEALPTLQRRAKFALAAAAAGAAAVRAAARATVAGAAAVIERGAAVVIAGGLFLGLQSATELRDVPKTELFMRTRPAPET